jgi:hypothetical protein
MKRGSLVDAIPSDIGNLSGARENPTWGDERIANELKLKLGVQVSPRTMRKHWIQTVLAAVLDNAGPPLCGITPRPSSSATSSLRWIASRSAAIGTSCPSAIASSRRSCSAGRIMNIAWKKEAS